MKLAKEPKEIDFVIKSEPWSKKDAADFRALMQEIKNKNNRERISTAKLPKRSDSTKSPKRLS